MSPTAENARPRTPPTQQAPSTSSATAGSTTTTTTATTTSNGDGIGDATTTRKSQPGVMPLSPKTPEKVRRIEESRLRAKAKREGYLAAQGRTNGTAVTPNGFAVTAPGRKAASATVTATPSTLRNASNTTSTTGSSNTATGASMATAAAATDNSIRPAKKFDKYIEYDFARMTDTKGGFLSADDDPHNRAMMHREAAAAAEQRDARNAASTGNAGSDAASVDRPTHMTEQEWERMRLLRSLRAARAGPFEPGVSALVAKEKVREGKGAEVKQCRECGSLDIDWKWEDVFNGLCVCNACREKMPDKYSLLTKTEVREDYLLTEPELKDPAILPHLSRPNPYKPTYSHMLLYLRCQVEDYAFSAARWGSAEQLDAEHERRETERKRRKEKKFAARLGDLRKRTRVEAWKRGRQQAKIAKTRAKAAGKKGRVKSKSGSGIAGGDGGGGFEIDMDDEDDESMSDDEDEGRMAQFGDVVGGQEKHVHEWGRAIEDPDSGVGTKTCIGCGMEVEELEF